MTKTDLKNTKTQLCEIVEALSENEAVFVLTLCKRLFCPFTSRTEIQESPSLVSFFAHSAQSKY